MGNPHRFTMESESPKGISKLRWIFMFSAWILVELISIAAFGYSACSVIILICGHRAGAAVFAGIIPGFILFIVGLYLYKLVRVPWRAGDYLTGSFYGTFQVRQVRLFHTILQADKRLKAFPHISINLNQLVSTDEKDGFLAYSQKPSGLSFSEQYLWMTYAWVFFCETFVFAILFLSLRFMVSSGLAVSASFLSGVLWFPNVVGILGFCFFKYCPRIPDGVHFVGLTCVLMEDHGTLHLRHFVVYRWLLSEVGELSRKALEALAEVQKVKQIEKEKEKEEEKERKRELGKIVWFNE